MKLLKTIKFSFLENFRNYSIILANIFPIAMFLLVSFVSTFFIDAKEVLRFLVLGQFLPISLMMLVLSFSFTLNISNFVEKRETKFFDFLLHTDLRRSDYYFGNFLSMIFYFNILIIPTILLFQSILNSSGSNLLEITFLSNLVFTAMYPLGILFSYLFTDAKKSAAWLTPINLILVFSVSMPSLFAGITGTDIAKINTYLIWNPMVLYNYFLQLKFNIDVKPWLSTEMIITLLLVLFAISFMLCYTFDKKKWR
ncbi:hypothetical protein ACS60E_03180 [Streptococcus suis]